MVKKLDSNAARLKRHKRVRAKIKMCIRDRFWWAAGAVKSVWRTIRQRKSV